MTHEEPTDGPLSWGPRSALFVVAGLVAAGALAWIPFTTNSADRFYAAVLALLALGALFAGLMMRRRLEVVPNGLRVGTVTGVRTITWSQVTSVGTTTRTHLGIGSATLMIDLGDDGLFVFGRTDLGTDPAEVATAINRVRPQW